MTSDRCTTCGKLKEFVEVYYGTEWLFTRKIQRCSCRESRAKMDLPSLDKAIKELEKQLKFYKEERKFARVVINNRSKEK